MWVTKTDASSRFESWKRPRIMLSHPVSFRRNILNSEAFLGLSGTYSEGYHIILSILMLLVRLLDLPSLIQLLVFVLSPSQPVTVPTAALRLYIHQSILIAAPPKPNKVKARKTERIIKSEKDLCVEGCEENTFVIKVSLKAGREVQEGRN